MAAFIRGMLAAFEGASQEPASTAPGRHSDGQRDAPIGWAVAALRWSPKPSAAAVASIGAVVVAHRAWQSWVLKRIAAGARDDH